MKKNGMMDWILWFAKIILGSAVFAVGFDLFLEPNDLNAGGVSGISMILIHLIGFGSVGTPSHFLRADADILTAC